MDQAVGLAQDQVDAGGQRHRAGAVVRSHEHGVGVGEVATFAPRSSPRRVGGR